MDIGGSLREKYWGVGGKRKNSRKIPCTSGDGKILVKQGWDHQWHRLGALKVLESGGKR